MQHLAPTNKPAGYLAAVNLVILLAIFCSLSCDTVRQDTATKTTTVDGSEVTGDGSDVDPASINPDDEQQPDSPASQSASQVDLIRLCPTAAQTSCTREPRQQDPPENPNTDQSQPTSDPPEAPNGEVNQDIELCPGTGSGNWGTNPEQLGLLGTAPQSVVGVQANGGQVQVPFELAYTYTIQAEHAWTAVFGHTGQYSWELALLDSRGSVEYSTSGVLGSSVAPLYQTSLRVAENGTVYVDFGPDWFGKPTLDLIVYPDGSSERLFLGESDEDGWVSVPDGFYHADTGEIRELTYTSSDRRDLLLVPGTPAAPTRVGDRAAHLYLTAPGESQRLVIETVDELLEIDLGSGFSLYQFPEPNVLIHWLDNRPTWQLELSTGSMTPLVPPASESEGSTYSLHDGWIELRSQVQGTTTPSKLTWTIDYGATTIVDYRELGLGDSAVVVAAEDSWFILDAGLPKFAVDRQSGDTKQLDLDDLGSTFHSYVVNQQLLVLADGYLRARIDLNTAEVERLGFALDAALDAVDALLTGDGWVIGVAANVPRWHWTLAEAAAPTPIPTIPELTFSEKEIFTLEESLLLVDGGLPLARLDARSGELQLLTNTSEATADTLPADSVRINGTWAFGFQGLEPTPVWRVNITEAAYEPIPELTEFYRLEDPRFLLPNSGENCCGPPPAEFSFDDGALAIVRRNDDAARVFVLEAGTEDWSVLGEPVAGITGLSVHRGSGWWGIAAVSQGCFCDFSQVDWGTVPDAGVFKQLIFTNQSPADIVHTATWTSNSNQTCFLITPAEAPPYVRDALTGIELALPESYRWTWLMP